MTEAVATGTTLVKPVKVAPLSALVVGDGAEALVRTVPEDKEPPPEVAVLRVVDALPVTVAVLETGTVPEIPEAVALAVPTCSAGAAQSHTEGNH